MKVIVGNDNVVRALRMIEEGTFRCEVDEVVVGVADDVWFVLNFDGLVDAGDEGNFSDNFRVVRNYERGL